MRSSIWKAKVKAALIHGIVTLVVAVATGSLVYWLWYPEQFAQMLGGTELYGLIVIVEICLGPVISLVIFNPNKPLHELIRDYAVVLFVQFSALSYGLFVVSKSRPAFVVFVKDSLEVVTALELDNQDLEQARLPEFQKVSWTGPKFVCSESPTDPKEKNDLLFSALEGRDIQVFPKYYRKCHSGEVESAYHSKELLNMIIERKSVNVLISELPNANFQWIPVKHRFGAWVKLIPENGKAYYLPFSPYNDQ